ncbi:MAG: 3'(2'),5'-bisphosphate nucleotidase [Anaerolineae bacterium UTCFX2]|jgi:3'(2'), 5'-bisphosphate nucleotidase|nr:3'(2'),5'-bisphosphate nucleotidase [Anaerolineae bacterium]MCZ7551786.1 3'(2'),5'-bisphosphate nucleotidase [Anaerolineales bacterium]OQY92576.1 MAG: 3'(2'),5'-bisphosphate nucleotidase [Anaerolineae bacterium UTCFX2]
MFNTHTPEVQFAIQAVQQAALLVRQVQAELVSPALTKDDRSPVTVADFASQALVARLLSQAFADDPLVAEEDSAALLAQGSEQDLQLVTQFVTRVTGPADPRQVCAWIDRGRADSASRFWTLDPIDGTKGFLRGDQYVVALALIQGGQVQIGALGCPNLVDGQTPNFNGSGSLVIAVRGEGAWTTSLESPGAFQPLRVSVQSDPSQARVLRSFESGHTNLSQIDRFTEALEIHAAPLRMDSQAKYAVLAAGGGDLLLRLIAPSKPDYREKIWDQAAGALVLEQAGGRISDLDGKNLDFSAGRMLANNRGVLASNGTLHAPALATLAQIGA